MASKEEFDALAFCLFVKLSITSSEIQNATARRLKELTHMGSDRLKRIVDYCVEHGLNFFISNKRLAEIAKCSVSKVRGIKNKMLFYGELERKFSNTLVFDNAETFNIDEYRKYCNDACFLFRKDGKVYKHNPNIYDYTGKNIMFVPKNNK